MVEISNEQIAYELKIINEALKDYTNANKNETKDKIIADVRGRVCVLGSLISGCIEPKVNT